MKKDKRKSALTPTGRLWRAGDVSPSGGREQQHPPSMNGHEHALLHAHEFRDGEAHGVADSGVLVLNHNFEPLNICGIRRGIVLVLMEKAEVIRYSEGMVHSVETHFPVPSVVRLHENIRRPVPRLKLSRKAVLARDDYTCVYCGSKSNLTIDHVFPRHRGGETTWENVVCCCLKCNNKKGSRTPQECGMRLPRAPYKPKYVPYISFPRFVSAIRRPEWREFLEGYGKGLERY
jgi:5-methylcytosine-specific restriction endonuclease McrA